jgi:hypothetical protein
MPPEVKKRPLYHLPDNMSPGKRATLSASLIAASIVLFAHGAFPRGLREPQYHRISVSDETVEQAKKICEEKKWSWADVRTHGVGGALAVFHPSLGGGEDRFTVNGTTGRISSEYTIRGIGLDGAKKSVMIRYFEDGSKAEVSLYRDEIPHGKNEQYHENGRLARETFYKHGKRHGRERVFDRGGKLIGSIRWKDGEEIDRR